MLGDINYLLKPVRPQYFLALPNETIISKLSEAYGDNLTLSLTEVNELSFRIPYQVEINHVLERNKNVDIVRERYKVLVQLGSVKQWFVIAKIEDKMEDSSDFKEVICYSLPYTLKDKMIATLAPEESQNARQILSSVLAPTTWTIGTLDSDFELTYRSFEFSNTSVLDAVFSIANTFNAIIMWDTIHKTVSFIKPELHGVNKGLTFSIGNYLKSLNKESDSDEMVTHLTAEGNDGLSITRINPTGQRYLSDYSYFMFPFERDEAKNTVRSSYYMSDELCHALLDYKELVDTHSNEFNTLADLKSGYQTTLSEKETEMNALKHKEAAVSETVLNQQIGNLMFLDRFTYEKAALRTYNFDSKTNGIYPYAVLCKLSNINGAIVKLDGFNKPIAINNTWIVLGKVNTPSSINVSISGATIGTEVSLQVAKITSEEFSASSNDAAIIDKYNLNNVEMKIAAKQSEINSYVQLIHDVDKQIDNLKSLLDIKNNLSKGLQDELNYFIIEKKFSDDKYIKDDDLLKATKEKFAELKAPQVSLDIDIVNFLEIIEEQLNWDKLNLGDLVNIKYPLFDLSVTAKIIKIAFDYESGNVKLTIANITDVSDAAKKLQKYIYDTKNAVSVLNDNLSKWTQAVVDTSEFAKIFENFWDKTTQEINMASNEYVTIDRSGITIIDPNDPLRFLRATHGVLGVTRSGGLRYETAISPDGVIAEMVLGKLILGQRVTIGDADGIWLTEGPKTTITDRYGREAMKLGLYDEDPDLFGVLVSRYRDNSPTARIINKIIMNSEVGFKIQQWNGIEYKDKFYVDADGLLYAEDMTTKRLKIVNDSNELLLDSYTKYMDIGKFDNIITDGKLTAIEKLQVKGEYTRIKSEYVKLLEQANIYKTTTRDSLQMVDPVPYTAAYNALIAYLDPLLSNMDATSDIDRNEFIQKFKAYYDATTVLLNEINASIKYSSLQLGSFYNKLVLDAIDGLMVTRSDDLFRVWLNATKGIAIEKNENGRWVQKFYVSVSDGRLWAEELVAKKLKIVSSMDEVMLDAESKHLNIGIFTEIIADGKLTALEKLTLKQEWETIQTDYTKILSQANQYKTSVRDGHTQVLVDIPPFSNAYNVLSAYVTPLLADMSATTTIDRTEFKNRFQTYYDQAQRVINEITNALKWSSVQLGQNYNNVTIDQIDGIHIEHGDGIVDVYLSATKGLEIDRNGSPVLFADTEGALHVIDLIAKRLKITSDPFGGASEDVLMLDAESRKLYLNRWDIIGAAAIDANMITANIVTANLGFISNLIAGKLSTTSNAAVSDWYNYVTIEKNEAKWITGKVSGEGTPATLPDGRALYWTHSSQSGQMTTDATPWPVTIYTMDEKVKMVQNFSGSGDEAYPQIIMGLGDGVIKDPAYDDGLNTGNSTNKSGRAFIRKPEESLDVQYFSRNYGKKRSLSLRDDGLYLDSEDSFFKILAKVYQFDIEANGQFSLQHNNGTKLIFDAAGNVELVAKSKLKLKANTMEFDATSYNFL